MFIPLIQFVLILKFQINKRQVSLAHPQNYKMIKGKKKSVKNLKRYSILKKMKNYRNFFFFTKIFLQFEKCHKIRSSTHILNTVMMYWEASSAIFIPSVIWGFGGFKNIKTLPPDNPTSWSASRPLSNESVKFSMSFLLIWFSQA